MSTPSNPVLNGNTTDFDASPDSQVDSYDSATETLDDFFDWILPKFETRPSLNTCAMLTAATTTYASPTKAEGSKYPGKRATTRGPKFYDMHLDSSLVLQKVKPWPEKFRKALSELVDSRVSQRRPPRIDPESPIHSRARQEKTANVVCIQENDELSIHNSCAYGEATIARVASALYGSTLGEVVDWSQEHEPFVIHTVKDMHGLVKAVGDGYLYVDVEHTPAKVLDDLAPAIEAGLCPFMSWEYKLPGCLDRDVWDALEYLASERADFKWEFCNHAQNKRCSSSTKCTTQGGQRARTGRRTGFDALKESIWPRESDGIVCSKSKEPPSGALSRAKLILQQVWAELVVLDTTFLILSNGNEEMLVIRHRDLQTAYLTKARPIARRNHVKERCGLILVALSDLKARGRALNEASRTIPKTLPSRYCLRYDNCGLNAFAKENLNSVVDVTSIVDNYQDILQIHQKLQRSQTVVVKWQDSLARNTPSLISLPRPPVKFHVPTQADGGSSNNVRNPSGALKIELYGAFKGASRTFSCYIDTRSPGTAETYPASAMGCSLVAKFGTSRDELEGMSREHSMYLRLHQFDTDIGHIPKVLGYYFSKSAKKTVMFLEYCGRSLINFNSIKLSTLAALHSWLTSIHVLGFTHGAIRADNILLDDDDDDDKIPFYVVSWTHARYYEGDAINSKEAEEDRKQDRDDLARISETLKLRKK